jgi:hypothetical protein
MLSPDPNEVQKFARLFDESAVQALRKVIDVSGDGPNNGGRTVTLARDEAVMPGITINGVPIMPNPRSGFGDIDILDHYFRECVIIGGPGAFMIPVRERQHFAEPIKTKIIREVAGISPEPLIWRAQSNAPINCAATGNPYYQGP